MTFLGTLPAAGYGPGVGGVSHVEMLILYKVGLTKARDAESSPRVSEAWTSNFSVGCSVGVRAGSLGHHSEHGVLCLVVLAGSFHVRLVPIIVGCGMLVGRSVAMGLLQGPGRLLRLLSGHGNR